MAGCAIRVAATGLDWIRGRFFAISIHVLMVMVADVLG
jgi:hypothetical protein